MGYHELAGTKVTLKKPLLVLRKKKVGGGGVGDQEPPAEVELEVIGIIRHKILFKDRPKALISSKLPTNPLFSVSNCLGGDSEFRVKSLTAWFYFMFLCYSEPATKEKKTVQPAEN